MPDLVQKIRKLLKQVITSMRKSFGKPGSLDVHKWIGLPANVIIFGFAFMLMNVIADLRVRELKSSLQDLDKGQGIGNSSELIGRVRRRYAQCILAPGGSMDRRVAGAQSGLVDMLALARTSVIYHGFMSSFAYTAHVLSRRPVRCLSGPGMPAGWHDSPADARHDRLIDWNFVTRARQQRALPAAPRGARLRAERLFLWTRLFFSGPCQCRHVRRMRRTG